MVTYSLKLNFRNRHLTNFQLSIIGPLRTELFHDEEWNDGHINRTK